jgi:predicted protein tyrosine phosphatase
VTKKTLTEIIYKTFSPYNNPYQGSDEKVVFICSAGILRSATMARMYAATHNTRCCGSAPYALIPLSNDLLAWADKIVFVHPDNMHQASETYDFDSFNKPVYVLNIPDEYAHMDETLVSIIKEQEYVWQK